MEITFLHPKIISLLPLLFLSLYLAGESFITHHRNFIPLFKTTRRQHLYFIIKFAFLQIIVVILF